MIADDRLPLGVLRRTLLALTTATTLAACGRPCDPYDLEGLANAMQDRGFAGRREAVAGLGAACPKLPQRLEYTLVAFYGEMPEFHRENTLSKRFEGDGYAAPFGRVCKPGREAVEAVVESWDRDREVFELCKLARYGLLDEGERFAFEDLDAYVLYEWLSSKRVDADISRKFVRGLLSATASADELLDRCLTHELYCPAAIARLGLTLPASSSDQYWKDTRSITITPSAVVFGGEQVLALSRGMPAPDAFVDHIHADLRRKLEAVSAADELAATQAGSHWDSRISILADADTPFATLGDVLFTASKANYHEFLLVVAGPNGLRTISVNPSLEWLEQDGPRKVYERAPGVSLSVTASELSASVGDEPSLVLTGDSDLQRLSAWLDQTHQDRPSRESISLRVGPDVPLQTLVALLDLARGPDCELPDGADHSECWFRFPNVDAIPSLHWTLDLIDGLRLTDAVADAGLDQAVGPTPEQVQAVFASRHEDIRKCLLADAAFIRGMDRQAKLAITWVRPSKQRKDVALLVFLGHADEAWASAALEGCIAEIFAFPVAPRDDRGELLTQRGTELLISYELPPSWHAAPNEP